MAEKSLNVTDGLSKWQIALLVAAPIACGLGAAILYYRHRRTPKSVSRDSVADEEKSFPCSTTATPAKDNETELSPTDQAQNWKNKGNKYFKGGNYAKAIECYTEAMSICPSENKDTMATFYQNRAAAHEKLNHVDEVIADTTKALEYDNRYVKALTRRARSYEAKGGEMLFSAVEDITAVCIIEKFSNPTSLESAERVLGEAAKVRAKAAFALRKPDYPSQHFVNQYFVSFNNDPIFDVLQNGTEEKHADEVSEKRLLQLQGENESDVESSPSSPYIRAVLELKKRRFDRLLDLCQEEIERRGTPTESTSYAAEARLLRASLRLLRGEFDKSMSDFETLLNMKGVSTKVRCNALIKRGSLRMQSADTEPAMTDFATAAREDPDNSDIYHHRGQMNLMMNRVEDAIRDFQRSCQLQPTFAIPHVQKIFTEFKYAQITHSQSQMSVALKNFEQALAKFPDCAEGYSLYAQVLAEQQQFDEADSNYKKVLEIEPGNGTALVHRGLLLLQWKQDIDGAVKLVENALKVDDRCAFAYETLATIEVQRGNLDKAIDMFSEAIKLARTEVEMVMLYKMHEAASAQKRLAERTGIFSPAMQSM